MLGLYGLFISAALSKVPFTFILSLSDMVSDVFTTAARDLLHHPLSWSVAEDIPATSATTAVPAASMYQVDIDLELVITAPMCTIH